MSYSHRLKLCVNTLWQIRYCIIFWASQRETRFKNAVRYLFLIFVFYVQSQIAVWFLKRMRPSLFVSVHDLKFQYLSPRGRTATFLVADFRVFRRKHTFSKRQIERNTTKEYSTAEIWEIAAKKLCFECKLLFYPGDELAWIMISYVRYRLSTKFSSTSGNSTAKKLQVWWWICTEILFSLTDSLYSEQFLRNFRKTCSARVDYLASKWTCSSFKSLARLSTRV